MDISVAGGGPYIKMAEQNGKYYILSDEIIYDNSTDTGKWIGVENKSAKTVSADNSFKIKSTYFSMGNHKESNFIGDTRDIMKQFGCDTDGIIDSVEYEDQYMIYSRYISSDEWKNFSREIAPRVNALNKYQILFYDFDGDGILEMWMKAYVDKSGWPETLSLFCTIRNGKVEQLLKCGECGGELGGDYVTLTYSEDDDQLRIGKFYHARGFGGVHGSLTSYNYSDADLKKYLEYSGTTYNDNMQPSEFKINGRDVTENEYREFTEKYHNIKIEDAEKLLYYTPPTASTKDRLKEMKVIL